jgi:hypothetical protein
MRQKRRRESKRRGAACEEKQAEVRETRGHKGKLAATRESKRGGAREGEQAEGRETKGLRGKDGGHKG